MSVSGTSIFTVLRIQGEADIEGENDIDVVLHPSLLDGLFRIKGKAYRVWRKETVKRGIEQRPLHIEDGEVIGIPIDPPDWVVMLYLEEWG